jgi:outer membrane protein TolC
MATAFCLFLCSGVFAADGEDAQISQPEQAVQTITLEQIRTLALANSRSLAKHNLAIQRTLLNERDRVFSNLPSPSVRASASMGIWNDGTRSAVNNNSSPDTFEAGISFGISQGIFEGGKTLIQKAINDIDSEMARQAALAEYFNVLNSADSAFYAVLESAAVLEAEDASLQTALAALAIAEVRLETGMINQGELLKAMADKVERENSLNQARRNLSLNTAKLRSLVGVNVLPPLQQIDISGYDDLITRLGDISDADIDSIYNDFLQLLVAANPALAQASLSSRQAEQNLSLAKRGYSPSIDASLSVPGLSFSQSRGTEFSGGVSLSLGMRIPVDFWAIANSVEKSRIARDIAALDYENASDTLELDLQSALLNLFSLAGTVLHSRLSLDYAQKNFDFVEERYRLFQSSISDLSEASALLVKGRNSLISANYGFLEALSALRSLGAIDDIEKILDILM